MEVYWTLLFMMQDRTFVSKGPLTLEETAFILTDYLCGKTPKAEMCVGYMAAEGRKLSLSVEYGQMPSEPDILEHLRSQKKYWFDEQIEVEPGVWLHKDHI